MKKLAIASDDVEDWNGVWTEKDVLDEMAKVGVDGVHWTEWVLDHVFDGFATGTESGIPQCVLDAFSGGTLESATLRFGESRASVSVTGR